MDEHGAKKFRRRRRLRCCRRWRCCRCCRRYRECPTRLFPPRPRLHRLPAAAAIPHPRFALDPASASPLVAPLVASPTRPLAPTAVTTETSNQAVQTFPAAAAAATTTMPATTAPTTTTAALRRQLLAAAGVAATVRVRRRRQRRRHLLRAFAPLPRSRAPRPVPFGAIARTRFQRAAFRRRGERAARAHRRCVPRSRALVGATTRA